MSEQPSAEEVEAALKVLQHMREREPSNKFRYSLERVMFRLRWDYPPSE